LGQFQGQVGALHCTAGGALGEVVQGRDSDHAVGVGVDGDLEQRGVGRRCHGGAGPDVLGQQGGEGVVRAGGLVGGWALVGGLPRFEGGRAGGEDPSGQGSKDGGGGQSD